MRQVKRLVRVHREEGFAGATSTASRAALVDEHRFCIGAPGLEVDAMALLWITSEQHPRTLSKSFSCQYQGQQYLIQPKGGGLPLRAAGITVCGDSSDDATSLLDQGRPLPYRVFTCHDLPPRIADDKTVDACVEAASRTFLAQGLQRRRRRADLVSPIELVGHASVTHAHQQGSFVFLV